MALQAERYLETVKRNAARYGESLAAAGPHGRPCVSRGVPSRDDDEEPPKKSPRKAKNRRRASRGA